MQTSTKKEYRDARRRSGEAVWSCRQGTATRGPCRRPARTFVVTSLVQRLFVPIRLGKAKASTAQRVNTKIEICMESTTLHAYFERLVTTTRSATCGLAHSTTLRRQKNRCAITIFLQGYIGCVPPNNCTYKRLTHISYYLTHDTSDVLGLN